MYYIKENTTNNTFLFRVNESTVYTVPLNFSRVHLVTIPSWCLLNEAERSVLILRSVPCYFNSQCRASTKDFVVLLLVKSFSKGNFGRG